MAHSLLKEAPLRINSISQSWILIAKIIFTMCFFQFSEPIQLTGLQPTSQLIESTVHTRLAFSRKLGRWDEPARAQRRASQTSPTSPDRPIRPDRNWSKPPGPPDPEEEDRGEVEAEGAVGREQPPLLRSLEQEQEELRQEAAATKSRLAFNLSEPQVLLNNQSKSP